MKTSNLTRQHEVLKALVDYQSLHGRTPTRKELKQITRLRSVTWELQKLQEAGCIRQVSRRQVIVLKKVIPQSKVDADELSRQRTAAGRKGRGVDIHCGPRRDADLEQRINDVVAMARAKEQSHSTDVVNSHRLIIRHGSLKVRQVG